MNADTGFNFNGYEAYRRPILAVTSGQNLSGLIDFTFFNSSSPAFNTLKYTRNDPSQVSLDDPTKSMENGDYYGILYIPPSFSQSLLTNILNASTHLPSPDAQNLTMTYIYSQARQLTVVSFVTNTIKSITSTMASQLTLGFIKESYQSPGGASSQYMSPTFLAQPFILKMDNIHQIPYFGLNFATYIASIVLWITAILITILNFKVFHSHAHDLYKFADDPWFKARYMLLSSLTFAGFALLNAVAYYIMLCILANSGSFMTSGYSWYVTLSFANLYLNQLP